MALSAGKLRHRVVLQSPVHNQDPVTGDVTTTWWTEAVVWAAVEPLSAREFIQSATEQGQIEARITIRFLAGIDPSWRAVHRGRIYNIHGALPDVDSGLEYMTLPVSAGVSDGR